MYQTSIFGKENSKNKVLHVPIGNENNTLMHAFDSHAPVNKYLQDSYNTCCLGSLANALFDLNEHVEEYAVVSRISSYL